MKYVEVGGSELAVTAFLGFVGPEDVLDLVAAKEFGDVGLVLGQNSGGGDGLVIAKTNFTVTFVFESVDKFVGFLAVFAKEEGGVLESGGFDRFEAKLFESLDKLACNKVAFAFFFWEEVSETFESLGSFVHGSYFITL